jgi:hypothetical protein
MAAKEHDALSDRLARLTYLCSEIHKAARLATVATPRLEEILREAEQLCRLIRKELKRRDA